MLSAKELLYKILNEINECDSTSISSVYQERVKSMLDYLIKIKYISAFNNESGIRYTLTERGKRVLLNFMEKNRNV